jgi:SAM-dependent methyltransferase
LIQRVGDRAFDWLNDIDTAAEVSSHALGFADERLVMYGVTSWRSIVEVRRLLDGLDITEHDVFMDVGCGKGRVACVAATYPFGRVLGLELSPELSTIAQRNVARNQSKFTCHAIEIITADARQSPIPDEVNLVYLNNPFVGDIFTAFIDGVCASLVRRPRLLLLIYHNPVMHEHLLTRGFRVLRRERRTVMYVVAGRALGG